MNNGVNNVIACDKIRKVYRDGNRELVILNGISLEIPEGKMVSITGPSGVGKSTLLHILGTLDNPSSGDLFFRGEKLSALTNAKINHIRNREIGFVFQFYHLLPEFTALENVMMAALCKGARRKDCKERAAGLLEQVGLKERMTHKPGQLSGGEQQRVAIARGLFNHPSVLLCDEPTGNLDERTGVEIVELLCDLNQSGSVTLIIVTHDDSIAKNADLWFYLHKGQARREK